MRSQQARARKAQKARAIRKDFERRRNINRHVPKMVKYQEEDRFEAKKRDGKVVFEKDVIKGQTILRPVMEVAGKKQVRLVIPVYRNRLKKGKFWEPKRDEVNRNVGMIGYPLPASFKRIAKAKRLELANK